MDKVEITRDLLEEIYDALDERHKNAFLNILFLGTNHWTIDDEEEWEAIMAMETFIDEKDA